MISDSYVWFAWSVAFLIPWAFLWVSFPTQRKAMLWASLFTMPFGLTEPLFVPEYWNPPSLFGLAQTTGFDIESLIFCFGIGGVAAVVVNVATRRRAQAVSKQERGSARHRFHRWAMAMPFIAFPFLWLLPWNAIYAGIGSMFVGVAATILCRPDLLRNSVLGALIFTCYYLIYLLGLEAMAPGFIERVWKLDVLSGIFVLGLPLEELLFAAGFGGYWAGVYEHFTWHRSVSADTTPEGAA